LAERFEEFDAWQRARTITGMIYALSETGAFARDFGLRNQMRRAAVSVMSNIAEGFESRTQGLFVEFLGRAKGSAGELRAQLYVAFDCHYLSIDQFRSAVQEVEICSKQITGLIRHLESHPNIRRVKEDQVTYEIQR
jgi:four helix bundle protein